MNLRWRISLAHTHSTVTTSPEDAVDLVNNIISTVQGELQTVDEAISAINQAIEGYIKKFRTSLN